MRPAIPAYWHKSKNFGDNIAPYLIKKITGLNAVYVSNESEIEHTAIVGSLLDTQPLNNTIVWGCGFAYSDHAVYKPKDIYAVRGELSRDRYLKNNIECPDVFGDPALLLPNYYYPKIEKKYKVGIIPHVTDFINVIMNYANKHEDYIIIDLSKPVESVIQQILSCEVTVSSSLHGLIVSHAYNIQSRWVEFSDNILGSGFKFRDYFTTVKTNEIPLDLRNFPDIKNIRDEIPEHEFVFNTDKLIKSCPLYEFGNTV